MKYGIEGFVQVDYFGEVEANSKREAIEKVLKHEIELSETHTHELDIVSIEEIDDDEVIE